MADDGPQTRIRHTQELRNARFLQTKAEPKLVCDTRSSRGEWTELTMCSITSRGSCYHPRRMSSTNRCD